MFTGIVEELGSLISIAKLPNSAKIKIAANKIMEDIKIGDSIACSGLCLTVTEFGQVSFSADISYESLELTAVKYLKPNDKINLERALKLSDRLGGHLISGHVDATAEIISIEKNGSSYRVRVSMPESVERFIAKKGSVAVDGVSLTVAEIGSGYFDTAVIPHTFETTNLSKKTSGSKVNIEADMLARYTEKLLGSKSNSDTDKRLLELLKEY